jgi:hypothetical protein
VYDGEKGTTGTPRWQIIAYVIDGVLLLTLVGYGILTFRRARKAHEAA